MSRPCRLSPRQAAQTLAPCRLGWLTCGRNRWRRTRRPLTAPVAALHPPTLGVAAAAAPLPLAAVVPEWPRIGGQVVRDWIGAGVDQLPGFSGDDEARLLFPDLVGLVDGPTFLISVTLFVAFVYWEGGVLLRALRERRQQGDQQQPGGREDSSTSSAALGSWDAGSPGEGGDGGWGEAGTQPVASEAGREQQRTQREELIDRARHERRRGLGLLALITAACIWMTGVVNSPSPFQP